MIDTKLGKLFKNGREAGENGLPVLSVTMNSGIVLRKSLERKMARDLSPEKSLLVRPGDIVYNMMRMWQGAVAVSSQRGVVSPAYVVCRPNDGINSLFAYYLFKAPFMLYQLKSYFHGITGDRLRLYFKEFATIPVRVPSLQIQKRIAEILATWDTAIDQTRKNIAAKKDRKKALMQQVLEGNGTLHWKETELSQAFQRIQRVTTDDVKNILSITAKVGFVHQNDKFSKVIAGNNLNRYI